MKVTTSLTHLFFLLIFCVGVQGRKINKKYAWEHGVIRAKYDGACWIETTKIKKKLRAFEGTSLGRKQSWEQALDEASGKSLERCIWSHLRGVRYQWLGSEHISHLEQKPRGFPGDSWTFSTRLTPACRYEIRSICPNRKLHSTKQEELEQAPKGDLELGRPHRKPGKGYKQGGHNTTTAGKPRAR